MTDESRISKLIAIIRTSGLFVDEENKSIAVPSSTTEIKFEVKSAMSELKKTGFTVQSATF